MQQMHEPEKRMYDQGYQEDSPGYQAYKSRQISQEYGEEDERQSYREGEQQKLQPVSGMDQLQRALAIALMVASSAVMAFSIAVFALSAENLTHFLEFTPILDLLGRFQSSFALSLVLMILAIVAFVFALLNMILSEKKYRRRGKGYRVTSL